MLRGWKQLGAQDSAQNDEQERIIHTSNYRPTENAVGRPKSALSTTSQRKGSLQRNACSTTMKGLAQAARWRLVGEM